MKAGFHPNIIAERSPREAAIAEVAAGNGITFLTGALKHLVIEGTTHRDLRGECVPSIQVFAAWRTERSPLTVPWLNVMFPGLSFPAIE
jgi:DNA-binding transcriptional LysR family regulator